MNSVVVTGLKEVDAIVPDEVNQAMLLCKPTRPHVGAKVPKRLRLSEPCEGIGHDGFYECQSLHGDTPILREPIL